MWATEHGGDPNAIEKKPSPHIPHNFRMARVIVFASVVLVGVASTYFACVVPNSTLVIYPYPDEPERNYSMPSLRGAVVASSRPIAPVGVPAGFRKELMASTQLPLTEFSRSFRQPIGHLCQYLNDLGIGKFSAMHNPIAAGHWTCSSDVLPVGDYPNSPNVSSLFIWIRGTDRNQVDLFRLKINLTDPATSETAKSLALTVLGKIHASLHWDMPDELKVAVEDVSSASFSRYGISYQITREWSSPPRLNVILRVTDRSGIVPAYAMTAKTLDPLPPDLLTPVSAKSSKHSTAAAGQSETNRFDVLMGLDVLNGRASSASSTAY